MKCKITDYMTNNKLEIERMINDYKIYVSTIIDNNSKKTIKEEDKEEIMSDVFLTIWHNKEKIDKNKELSPYIAGVTKNLVNNHIRKMKNTINTINIEDVELQSLDNIELLIEKEEILKAIKEELNNLSDIDYKIFTKFYYSGKNIKEIAKELKLSKNNVGVRLYRIRKNINKGLEKKNIKYKVFVILLTMLMVSGITFAAIYLKNVFGDNARQGTNTAIESGYIDNIKTEVVTSNNIDISVDYTLMDDASLYLLFNIDFNEFEYNANTKVKFKDMLITDENKNIVFCGVDNYSRYERYCKDNNIKYDRFMSNVYGTGYGINIVEHNENNIKLSYTINSENNPRSKKLYINFSEIEIENVDYENDNYLNPTIEIKNLMGKWNIELEIPEEFYNRETYNYKLKESSDSRITLEYAYVTQTCTKIRFFYKKENKNSISNTEDIINNALNSAIKKGSNTLYPYIKTTNGKMYNISNTNDGDGLRTLASSNGIYTFYNTFSLTIYDATDEITAYFFNDEGEKIKLRLIKQ